MPATTARTTRVAPVWIRRFLRRSALLPGRLRAPRPLLMPCGVKSVRLISRALGSFAFTLGVLSSSDMVLFVSARRLQGRGCIRLFQTRPKAVVKESGDTPDDQTDVTVVLEVVRRARPEGFEPPAV